MPIFARSRCWSARVASTCATSASVWSGQATSRAARTVKPETNTEQAASTARSSSSIRSTLHAMVARSDRCRVRSSGTQQLQRILQCRCQSVQAERRVASRRQLDREGHAFQTCAQRSHPGFLGYDAASGLGSGPEEQHAVVGREGR